jgi:fimbrial chaperone protein
MSELIMTPIARACRFALPSLLAFFLLCGASYSAEWQVIPIRLDFDRNVKTGVVTVKNLSSEKLNIQMNLSEWTQDAEGKDQYRDTQELIFLPKIATIEPKGEQVLRVGIRTPALTAEKCFRLFITEISQPRPAGTSTVAIAMRFGVPIFVKPLKEEVAGKVEKAELNKGTLSLTVKNVGNVYFNIRTITVKGVAEGGRELFSKEVPGWYLLSGASRTYSIPLDPGACDKAVRLEYVVKTDKNEFKDSFVVEKGRCSQ